ncbi:MAG: YgiW/YdeI family stress tolerance OB fold protein [Deltaproteobacteria bacterium]|nr:YgiW/YdeI family stress tolerance OB fold protein [Deltaproteobacteria bacterium]
MIVFLICVFILGVTPSLAPAASGGGFVSGSADAPAGGFSGPGLSPTTAKDAATMRDDAHVVLRGNIVQHLGKDKYLFRDASGTIRVEIDGDKWAGQTIAPGDTVEIHGEVDKDWNSVEVEVERIVKVQ